MDAYNSTEQTDINVIKLCISYNKKPFKPAATVSHMVAGTMIFILHARFQTRDHYNSIE